MKDENNTVLATNFVLLDNIKDSLGIKRPHPKVMNLKLYSLALKLNKFLCLSLKIDIVRESCNSTTSSQEMMLTVNVSAPAIFVYIQLHHPQIENYNLSKNGFIQIEPIENVNITITNPDCSVPVKPEHFRIQTVNDFMISSDDGFEQILGSILGN